MGPYDPSVIHHHHICTGRSRPGIIQVNYVKNLKINKLKAFQDRPSVRCRGEHDREPDSRAAVIPVRQMRYRPHRE